jgi:ABC-type transport system involved in cytochrome bd biosynthesis fused ATPase/permease subunit
LVDAATIKTALLEDLRSEKRILEAEKEEAIAKLLDIQHDLEDTSNMERIVMLEAQKLDEDLENRILNPEYQQIRGNTPQVI